jgi:hypothetical protein
MDSRFGDGQATAYVVNDPALRVAIFWVLSAAAGLLVAYLLHL